MNSDKKYIAILLTTTLISVGIMTYFINITSYYEVGYNFEIKKDEDGINNKDELIVKYEEKLDDKSVQDIESDLNDDSKNDGIIEENLDSNNEYKEKIDSKSKESSNNNKNNTIGIESLEQDESVAVFKVDKNSIINEIPNKDKLKLIKMANNLSISDYKELVDHVKRNDELPAAIDIFKLLKRKLTINDYEQLTKILLPYIDIDMIENIINEK